VWITDYVVYGQSRPWCAYAIYWLVPHSRTAGLVVVRGVGNGKSVEEMLL
jgi:hypothetical protein